MYGDDRRALSDPGLSIIPKEESKKPPRNVRQSSIIHSPSSTMPSKKKSKAKPSGDDWLLGDRPPLMNILGPDGPLIDESNAGQIFGFWDPLAFAKRMEKQWGNTNSEFRPDPGVPTQGLFPELWAQTACYLRRPVPAPNG